MIQSLLTPCSGGPLPAQRGRVSLTRARLRPFERRLVIKKDPKIYLNARIQHGRTMTLQIHPTSVSLDQAEPPYPTRLTYRTELLLREDLLLLICSFFLHIPPGDRREKTALSRQEPSGSAEGRKSGGGETGEAVNGRASWWRGRAVQAPDLPTWACRPPCLGFSFTTGGPRHDPIPSCFGGVSDLPSQAPSASL